MPKDEKRKVGPVYRVFSQDLHSTQLHGEAIGFRQLEMWRSKSRQFSKDAAIIGNIETTKRSDDKEKLPSMEKDGFIILRKSLWSDVDKLDRRLVVKLFTESGGWVATMEEMVAEEYAASFVSDIPLIAFTVLSKESEIVTWVKQHKRGALSTENYSFYILGPDNTFEAFRIEGSRGSMGDDFEVVRLNGNQKVAQIDSKFGDLGGEFLVKVKDPVLAQNEWFCRVLQCFSIMVAYREEIKDKINKGFHQWKKGKKIPKQHRFEISLLANPRKLTLKLAELEEV
ncbi:MAG: hypothetical protein RTV31_01395 [Candidatus Thorarchaeota archaeon]